MDQIQEEWESGASGSSVVGLIHPASLLESFWLSRRWSPPPHMVKTTTPLSGHLDWHWKRNGIIKKKNTQKALIQRKTKKTGNNGTVCLLCTHEYSINQLDTKESLGASSVWKQPASADCSAELVPVWAGQKRTPYFCCVNGFFLFQQPLCSLPSLWPSVAPAAMEHQRRCGRETRAT